MALIGRLHPLLIHFPIALVLVASAVEAAALAASNARWHAVSALNLRIAAAFAVLAVVAGWQLATEPGMGTPPLLDWHRWLGTAGAAAALVGALTTARPAAPSPWRLRMYRVALFGAGVLIIAAGHIGGVLVWGSNFLRP